MTESGRVERKKYLKPLAAATSSRHPKPLPTIVRSVADRRPAAEPGGAPFSLGIAGSGLRLLNPTMDTQESHGQQKKRGGLGHCSRTDPRLEPMVARHR